ncbi:MAG: thioredoxin family protein [Bacilli bacterium]
MGLFSKKEKKTVAQDCGCGCGSEKVEKVESTHCDCCNDGNKTISSIKVLGSGCKSCHLLYVNTQEAVKNCGLEIEVEYITDMAKVVSYGVMSMPVLVINEKIASSGQVLKVTEIENLFKKIGC